MSIRSHAHTLGGAVAERRRLHLSCAELARRCQMSESDLRRIEHDRFAPSPAEAQQLALELRIDPDTFCRCAMLELFLHQAYLVEHAARAA